MSARELWIVTGKNSVEIFPPLVFTELEKAKNYCRKKAAENLVLARQNDRAFASVDRTDTDAVLKWGDENGWYREGWNTEQEGRDFDFVVLPDMAWVDPSDRIEYVITRFVIE